MTPPGQNDSQTLCNDMFPLSESLDTSDSGQATTNKEASSTSTQLLQDDALAYPDSSVESCRASVALDWPYGDHTTDNAERPSTFDAPATHDEMLACGEDPDISTASLEHYETRDSPQVAAVDCMVEPRSLRSRKHLNNRGMVNWQTWENKHYKKLDARWKRLQLLLISFQQDESVEHSHQYPREFEKKCGAMIEKGLAGKQIPISRIKSLQVTWRRCLRSGKVITTDTSLRNAITKALTSVLSTTSFIEGIFEHGTTYQAPKSDRTYRPGAHPA